MPETPDFDQIAARTGVATISCPAVAEQLRLVWNARGAADLATIEATITYALSASAPGLVSYLDRALRSLDR